MSKLREQVREFHKVFGIDDRNMPGIPSAETVKSRLRLIAEEFLELFEACGVNVAIDAIDGFDALLEVINLDDVDLPAVVDALGDLDYVIEGTRLQFGVNGDPIADAIHTANMAKGSPCVDCDGRGECRQYSGVFDDHGLILTCRRCRGSGRAVAKNDQGKVVKPKGWSPPDIDGALRKQGWAPSSGDAMQRLTALAERFGFTASVLLDRLEAGEINVSALLDRLEADCHTMQPTFTQTRIPESSK